MATSKRYREQAALNVQQAKQLKSMSTELSAAKKKLSNKKSHVSSVKMHRSMANEAMEQRNVARDKLKEMQQELNRWQSKYVVCMYIEITKWLKLVWKYRYHNLHMCIAISSP